MALSFKAGARTGGQRTSLLSVEPERAAPFVFGALVLVAFGYLMWESRGNTFFYDEWTWLFTRRNGLSSILASYNSHMMIAPTALYQVLFRTIGLRDYWVFRLLATVAHLSLATVVFIYARRRVGVASVLLILPFLVLGTGWEDVIWAINIGVVTSLALSVGALLALERDDRRRNALACVLLIAAFACSEVALVFAIGLAVELTWRDRSLRSAWVWLIPLILYGCWWLGYYEPTNMGSGVTAMPAFAARLAAAAIGGLLGLDINWGMSLLVVAVVLAAIRLSKPGVFTPRIATLLVAGCVYWLLVAYGRNANPDAARYVYVGSLMMILFAAEALRGVRFTTAALVAGLLLALFAVLGNIHTLKGGEGELRNGSQIARADLGALDLARRFASPALFIDSTYMPGMTAEMYFETVRALDSTPADSPAEILREPPAARTAADVLLEHAGELTVVPAPRSSSSAARAGGGGAAPAPAVQVALGGAVTHRGRCLTFKPKGTPDALALWLSNGGLVLHAAAGPDVEIFARRFAPAFGGAPVAPLSGGQTVLIRSLADRSTIPWGIQVSPSQAVTVCAVA